MHFLPKPYELEQKGNSHINERFRPHIDQSNQPSWVKSKCDRYVNLNMTYFLKPVSNPVGMLNKVKLSIHFSMITYANIAPKIFQTLLTVNRAEI